MKLQSIYMPLLIAALLLLLPFAGYSQTGDDWAGYSPESPVDCGSFGDNFIVTDTKTGYPIPYLQESNPLYYRFTLEEEMMVIIHNFGTTAPYTHMAVYESQDDFPGSLIVETSGADDALWIGMFPFQDDPQANILSSHAALCTVLQPGTYFVVPKIYKGSSQAPIEGEITTTIRGQRIDVEFPPMPEMLRGQDPVLASHLGTVDFNQPLSDSRDMMLHWDLDGDQSREIYYYFDMEEYFAVTFNASIAGCPVGLTLFGPDGRLLQTVASVDNVDLRVPLEPGRYMLIVDAALTTESDCMVDVSIFIEPYGDPGPDVSGLTSWNYIYNLKPLVPATSVAGLSAEHVFQSVQYFDGLGGLLQTVDIASSRDAGGRLVDIVAPVFYDSMRRDDARVYLPYVSAPGNGGRYDNSWQANQKAYYTGLYGAADAAYAYTEKVYEASPLSRPLEQWNVGSAFRQAGNLRRSTFAHETNSANEVRMLRVSGDSLYYSGYYPACTLLKNSVTNEDGLVVTSYTDLAGLKVLDKAYDGGTGVLLTYYGYDCRNLLCWVVSPEGSAQLPAGGVMTASDDVARRYCYVYTYDGRGRMTSRQLPGRGVEYMVYDLGERMALSQDAAMREAGGADGPWRWMLCRYDALGRQTGQYVVETDLSHADLALTFANAASAGIFLADHPGTPVSLSAYDVYPDAAASLSFEAVDGVVAAADIDSRTRGMKTWERVAVLDGDEFTPSARYVERTFHYDRRGRLVQSVERNHLGGISRVSLKYDFVGNVLSHHESVQPAAGATPDILRKSFTYDHRGRLMSESSTLGNGTSVSAPAVVEYAYDELGKLKSTTSGAGSSGGAGSGSGSGSNSGTFTTTSSYNIQGWLTSQESPYFSMGLRYFDPVSGFGTGRSYTGNIMQWEWSHDPATPSAKQMYCFHYDKFSRLVSTDNLTSNGTTWTYSPTNFCEYAITYDRNGNFMTLRRNHAGLLQDNISDAVYNGNQIVTIKNKGVTASYAYDANGNCTTDGLNALKMDYNFLNLTSVARDMSGAVKAKYTWNADGAKLSVRDASGTGGLEYAGSLIYKRTGASSLALEGAAFGGGRIVKTAGGSGGADGSGSNYEVDYFVLDHLGSARVIVVQTTSGGAMTVRERNNFYPFGERRAEASLTASTNRFRFTGHEDQPLLDNKFMDAGARFLGKKLPVWGGIDPLAEMSGSVSPYLYCGANPVRNVDPDGRDWFQSTGGATLWMDEYRKQVTIRDEIYNNIGASYSSQMLGGGYVNYYQNQVISISSAAVDAEQTVLGSKALTGALLSRSGPLTIGAQSQLMTSRIHQGQADFVNHPVTRATVNITLFVVTGGIEWGVSLAGRGIALLSAKAAAKEGAKIATKEAATTGIQGAKSLGAAGKGFSQTLQTGGHKLKSSTLKALNLTEEQGRNAIHALKEANNISHNSHYKIMGNGDIVNPHTGKYIDNLYDYL